MNISIKDLMTREVKTATPSMTIQEAARLMKTEDIGSLPVCEGKKVVGMVTDRDLAVRAVAEGFNPTSTRVADVMSKEVVVLREDSDLSEAKRLMHDRQLRRLPVIDDDNELIGYVAMARIARTESAEESGKVLQGVSEASTPAPMEEGARKRRKKTG